MSTSATIFGENGLTGNRRRCPREPLNWVVLVFFGETNWGKLVNLNENGMCFEFEERPSLGQRISFTIEAMGRMPASFGGEVISNSFQAAGEIKWTRDFERAAGVQFADLAEESREQIRHWLSFKASTSPVTLSNEVKREVPAPQPELLEPAASSTEGLCKAALDGSAFGLEKSEWNVEPQGTLEVQLVTRILDRPAFEADSALSAEAKPKCEPVSASKGWMAGIGVMAVSVGLATLAVVVGLKTILPLWARRTEVAERIPSPSVKESEPIGAKNRSGTRNPSPFLVEVLDAESRRWLLWFVNKTSKTVAGKAANKSILPTSLPLLAKSAVQVQRTVSASRESTHEFTLTAPKVSHPRANGLTENSTLNTAPLISSEEPSPLEGATGGILAVPVTRGLPVGGQMQKARLITSVLPVYPPLAMKNHVTGDVTVDALIDATGKVTIVKVISGPSLLREAATDALRLWMYEPAWLDGHAVSTHLTVTVKFHFK